MSLSKQLYIIISLIFFMIFAGNFIISVKNTKEYLELESATKAQDTATSLGMTIKPLIHNKKDAEIESIIKAIANRGFYKEIRLEDTEIIFTASELIAQSKDLDPTVEWKIENLTVDSKYGTITMKSDDAELDKALEALENSAFDLQDDENTKNAMIYTFTPTPQYKDGGRIIVTFNAKYKNETLPTTSSLNLSKILVKELREEKFDYVPQWFINMIPLSMQEKSSQISDGWHTVATVYVSANAGDAYAKLYEQARGAVAYSIIALGVSIGFLVFFLQLILKPLKAIEKLAMNIANGQFTTMKLPWTTEIKNVAISMNDMSTKIEGIIRKLNANIENMTNKISRDDLTGLELKQSFETDMKKMFISKSKGYVLSLKITSLAAFAKNNNNSKVDQFIKDFALILKTTNEHFKFEITAYRFFGSEFAMIISGANKEDIQNLCLELKDAFEQLGKSLELSNISNIGATPFNPIGTTPEMVIASNEARETAKQVGPNEAFIRDEKDLARDMEAWRALVFDIIENAKFHVGYIQDAHLLNGEDEGQLVMQEAFTDAKDNNGDAIPIGTFISIAEKYDKIVEFDKAVVSRVIEHIHNKQIKHDISINLSLDSIVNVNFIEWIKQTLHEEKAIASQLVFSITAYGVAKDISQFKAFTELINQHGAKIIVKRFESKFIPLDSIKDLHIDYIRLARDYTNGISTDSGKYAFVESMQDLSNLLNIKLFAENVKADEDLEKIKALNLYAASR